MPVYDYFCQTCGYQFERRLLTDENRQLIECPNCGLKAQRKFTAPAVIFKGSGFYKTDNHTPPKSSSKSAGS